MLSSLEGSNLVKINKSLLPCGWSVLWRLCSFFPWGEFSLSLLGKMLLISPVLPGFQGGCKVNSSEQIQIQKWR
jgi:hypothetical protein